MEIEIKNRFNGEMILCGEYESIKDCIEKNRSADLSGADFRGADFSGADFRGADLRGADFSGADFSGADFDMSCWPLWCGSLQVKTSRKLRVQLMFHTLSPMNHCEDLGDDEKEIYNNCIKYANEFHRDDVEKLKPMEEK